MSSDPNHGKPPGRPPAPEFDNAASLADNQRALASDDSEAHSLELLRALARKSRTSGPEHDSPSPDTNAAPPSHPTGADSPEPLTGPPPSWLATGPNPTGAAPPEPLTGPRLISPWYRRRHTVLIAIVCCSFALVLGAAGLLSHWVPHRNIERALPPSRQAEAGAPITAPPQSAQARSQNSAELQSVQKAMADCDREAAQNPKDLYLLIIPISPNTDAARTTVPESEAYQTFFLMSSKATLAGLQDTSYRINPWPFAFSIVNPNTRDRRDWNLVSGLTQLSYAAEQFGKFRVGFDVSGRGYGLEWSNEYSRQEGVCYWINVRFRS